MWNARFKARIALLESDFLHGPQHVALAAVGERAVAGLVVFFRLGEALNQVSAGLTTGE